MSLYPYYYDIDYNDEMDKLIRTAIDKESGFTVFSEILTDDEVIKLKNGDYSNSYNYNTDINWNITVPDLDNIARQIIRRKNLDILLDN